jgi:hypothetical protein
MDMEVIHRLPPVGLAVHHKPRALFSAPQFHRQGLGLIQQRAQQGVIPAFDLHDIPNVPFRNEEKVKRRLGRNVMEGQKRIILIDFATGDFPRGDFTKNTILHEFSLPCPAGIFEALPFNG